MAEPRTLEPYPKSLSLSWAERGFCLPVGGFGLLREWIPDLSTVSDFWLDGFEIIFQSFFMYLFSVLFYEPDWEISFTVLGFVSPCNQQQTPANKSVPKVFL